MDLKCKTGKNSDIRGKYKVYFTCHPEDFDSCFIRISDDILSIYDCAIFYTKDMSVEIPEEDKQMDIYSNNLFVIPVTKKLLTTPNRAMDSDFVYANKENMRILPIMMEKGLDTLYALEDKFGEMQYLKAYECDSSEISYQDKLKKYLNSVFLGDEITRRIRAAFDAYIFLSYRKIDRNHANKLMRLIHSNPECRDIAIWFDEFLTPGESFKENIEKILDDCQLFTLLVTPNLLEKVICDNGDIKDNYVISTELPLAQKNKVKKGTDIFAVEMELTDKAKLKSLDIDDYVNYKDPLFRENLLDIISQIAITSNNTPEHNFLIGLAYMEGIDVEVDREKGLTLINDAAEAGLLEAIYKMVDISKNSNPRDKDTIVSWLTKSVILGEKEFIDSRDKKVLSKLIEDVACLFDILMHYNIYSAKDMFIHIVHFDSFLLKNEFYQEPDDEKKLCSACKNLFRHRAKKIALNTGRKNDCIDFEEWLSTYERFCLRKADFGKCELATAYLNYAEFLEENDLFEASIEVSNKLLQLSISETKKFEVSLKEDFSDVFIFDVPDEVYMYTFWLSMTLSGHYCIAISDKHNQKQRLLCIKNILDTAELLRGHSIPYQICGNIANCYKFLEKEFETLGEMSLSLKARDYVKLIEDGMPNRKRIIPPYSKEINIKLCALIEGHNQN